MQKWRRTIIFDVAMIILVILLFSPYHVGLSPLDPNFFKAALSVVVAAFLGYETVKVNRKAILTNRANKRLTAGGDKIPVEDIKRMLGEYEKKAVVGKYARSGMEELESAQRKRDSLFEVIGTKFQEGSLSWQKFTDVVESATQAVAHNSALLARRIQAFDVDDYNRNAHDTITGLFRRSTVPESVRQEKRALYEASLDDMRGIIGANERLLLELDKFSIEMGQFETNAQAEANTQLLEEINTLIDETKYYQ